MELKFQKDLDFENNPLLFLKAMLQLMVDLTEQLNYKKKLHELSKYQYNCLNQCELKMTNAYFPLDADDLQFLFDSL